MRSTFSLTALLLACTAGGLAARGAEPATNASIELAAGDLRATFRDNSESPRVLSGVDALFNTRHAPTFDAFDPDGGGASAGLNFEHIISGHQSPHNKFTPRSGPFTLQRGEDGRSVVLVRRREDCPWDVSATLRYTLAPPNAIDFEFRCTPHDAARFGERGYAIFFFANYMNDVADVPIHFRGIDKPDGEEKWIAADAPPGHADWNSGGTYRHRDARDLEYDADVDFRLNHWSYQYPRFTQPFYYGRAANGMTFILMFDRAVTPEDQIRFSLFKFKLRKHPRPAWDAQYVVNRVAAEKDYGFRGRLVWKQFVSADDCWRQYKEWTKSLRPPM